MKTNKLFNILVATTLVGGGLITSSCADDLDLTPRDWYTAESFWKTQTDFEGNVTALMNQFRGNYAENILFYAGELRAGAYEFDNYLDGSSLTNATVVKNQYSAANYQFSNFGNYYGLISNCNTFLYYAEEKADIFDESAINYMKGIIYGLRAYSFFQIYKMWGPCPLRLDADVILGNYDVSTLYMGRSSASVILEQIKSDIATSLSYFASGDINAIESYDYGAYNGTIYWSKAATEMLAGEVYLWSAKVSCDDYNCNTNADSDVATAKSYFTNVLNNYGFALEDNYYDIWSASNRSCKEAIFSMYYDYNETTYGYPWYQLFSTTTGLGKGKYWIARGYAENVNPGVENQFPYSDKVVRLGYNQNFEPTMFFTYAPNFVNRNQVKNAFAYQFDREDCRDAYLLRVYLVAPDDDDLNYIDGYDTDTATMAGCYVYKFAGQNNSTSQIVGGNNMPIYRLALVYTYLAEIANYQGDYALCAEYINKIRQRAYGDNWDAAKYGYTAGTFRENESAILHEKDKEFYQEGQRWWDLRRLTSVKGGAQTDHLVFCPESNIGWGVDRSKFNTNHWNEVSDTWTLALDEDNQIDTTTPVLDTDQEYMLLWPIDQETLSADKELEKQQNPGY
ncbi:MAG: RagB/SusD family nutrient uptake outer membrane protein [Bacteroidales bacterium]|nr:RagB/SusD family nutrient uptake outer membrane protein [Bacteroidales bacterium]